MVLAPMPALRAALQQVKEGEPIPLRARHVPGHRAQRLVYLLLIAKAFLQHLHHDVLSLVLAREAGAWSRKARVAGIAAALSCRLGTLPQKRLRRSNPQLGL